MFKISLLLLFVANALAVYTNGGGYSYGQQMQGGMSCTSMAECPSGASCQYGQCMMQNGMYNNPSNSYGGSTSWSTCNGQYCQGPCTNGICMSAASGGNGYGNMPSYGSLPSMMNGGGMNGAGCANCPVGLCQNGVCMSSSYNNMNGYNSGGYNNYG